MAIFNSYGIDEETIMELQERGCQLVEVHERDTGTTYQIPFDLYREKAIYRAIGRFPTRSYVRLNWWTRLAPGAPLQTQLALPTVPSLRGGLDRGCPGSH